MPKMSIITAAYGPKALYLSETARSVQDQRLPDRWELEWIVQEDGAQSTLAPLFDGFPNVMFEANNAQLGISSTRNLALARATGELVQVLDHDDVLLPDALSLLIRRFEEHPHIHWAVGAADDLLTDGTRKSWDSALPFGLIEPGVPNRWAETHGGNWPVHCAGLMIRTEALRAIGGWAGIPVDDDLVTFSALCEMGAGWNEETVTWLYRQHPGQTTRDGTLKPLMDRGRLIALQRAQAVRNAGMTLPSATGFDSKANSANVHLGENIKQPADLR